MSPLLAILILEDTGVYIGISYGSNMTSYIEVVID